MSSRLTPLTPCPTSRAWLPWPKLLNRVQFSLVVEANDVSGHRVCAASGVAVSGSIHSTESPTAATRLQDRPPSSPRLIGVREVHES